MELPLDVDFTGRVAVVTGAGGVLCSCMSKALAAAGAKVALLDINLEAAQKVVDEIISDGGEAIAIRCDILDGEQIKAAHDEVLKTFGKTNILLNGAGGNNPRAQTASEIFDKSQLGKEQTLFDLTEDGFRFVFDINFTGTFMVTKEFALDMIDGGEGNTILNIASVNTWLPLTKIPAYAAAKEAVGNFTKWLAMYFSGVGIRVNAIAPGFLATYQTHDLFYNADGSPTARLGRIIAGTPMGRLGEPEELLGAILFLLDEKASGFITGAVLPIDGGYTAYSGV